MEVGRRRTVAERGPSSMSAISPKAAPGAERRLRLAAHGDAGRSVDDDEEADAGLPSLVTYVPSRERPIAERLGEAFEIFPIDSRKSGTRERA